MKVPRKSVIHKVNSCMMSPRWDIYDKDTATMGVERLGSSERRQGKGLLKGSLSSQQSLQIEAGEDVL